MDKTIKYLVLAAMAVSTNLSAHTEQTYMNLRSASVNLPMELTTFYERTQLKLEQRFGGNLQVAGFYGESGSRFGNYFGINNKSKYALKYSAAANTKSTVNDDFDLGYILHMHDSIGTEPTAEVSLNPKTMQYGARFDYYQNMDKILTGLYFKVNTAIVCVENKMELYVDGDNADSDKNLTDYFRGEYVVTDATSGNLQSKLEKGLMKGTHTETGVADIDVIIGYKYLYQEKYHLGINLAITIPTGENPEGIQMFEPIYGNRSHFGLGGGLDAHARLWKKGAHNMKLNFALNYRYLTEASEYRPLKLKDYKSQYVLLGKKNVAPDKPLMPAVNVLTPLGVSITPGSQVDGILALVYNYGGLSLDIGYNMYYRETEEAHIKGSIETEMYGVAARDFNTADAFGVAADHFDGGVQKWLTNHDIDAKKAATPSQFTNGIYGGLGYHTKDWDFPLLIGIGGKYDLADEDGMPDMWSAWAKLAFSF